MPWIVTVSVLHGVRDFLFPRSCSLRMNTRVFESNGLITTLKSMVQCKCTCADDTRKTTTQEILYIQTDTYEMSAQNEKYETNTFLKKNFKNNKKRNTLKKTPFSSSYSAVFFVFDISLHEPRLKSVLIQSTLMCYDKKVMWCLVMI